jgi:ADP-heptose:LPS heptosyltransferase
MMGGWQEARNILVMRLDNAGDVIMLGPALRAVRETVPAARLTLLASPAGTAAAPLLPWLDAVITWRASWQDLGRLSFSPERELALVAQLRAQAFDAAVIFTSFSQTPHAPGYACYLAGIPLRAGESKEFGGAILTDELRGAPDELHQIERNLRLVESLGFRTGDRRLHVTIPATARASSRSALARHGVASARPFVLVHPGASAAARRYPPERVGAVARGLLDLGYQVVVTGTARESALVAQVAALAEGICVLAEATTLPEYAALLARAAVVVCGNTLPLHLADAVGTPVVALFAGTDLEEQWQPRATPARLLRRPTPCYPCYRFDCPIGQPCLAIEPAEVIATVAALLPANVSA